MNKAKKVLNFVVFSALTFLFSIFIVTAITHPLDRSESTNCIIITAGAITALVLFCFYGIGENNVND